MANAEQQPDRRHVFSGHKKVSDLHNEVGELGNRYFSEEPCQYPMPEFEVSRVKHNPEGREGLRCIRGDEDIWHEFYSSLVWWSLVVGDEEITSAEEKEMATNKKETKVRIEPGCLKEFATSPAFQQDSPVSTYPLQEVLQIYSQKFCDGKQPTMRAFRTYLYGQEVLYVVLVHRPCDDELFSDYPLLTDTPDPVCAYRGGCIIWKAQAMCGTHRYVLRKRTNKDVFGIQKGELEPQPDYVWDRVIVALHVREQVVKSFDNEQNPAEDEELAALFQTFHV